MCGHITTNYNGFGLGVLIALSQFRVNNLMHIPIYFADGHPHVVLLRGFEIQKEKKPTKNIKLKQILNRNLIHLYIYIIYYVVVVFFFFGGGGFS